MAYALTVISLVAGLAVFFSKYVATFGKQVNRKALVARLALVLNAIVVLVGPIDWCTDWALRLDEALPSAFIVALSEVYGVTCGCKCGIATATVACAYALANAEHETACGGSFFGASVGGIVAAVPVWIIS